MSAIEGEQAINRQNMQPQSNVRLVMQSLAVYLNKLRRAYPFGVPRKIEQSAVPGMLLLVVDLRGIKEACDASYLESDAGQLMRKVVESGLRKEFRPAHWPQFEESGDFQLFVLLEPQDDRKLADLIKNLQRKFYTSLRIVVLSDDQVLVQGVCGAVGPSRLAAGASIDSLHSEPELKKALWQELKRYKIV